MLVFQRAGKNERSGQEMGFPHIATRFEERVGSAHGLDVAWLLECVAEINRYLPDDWRMTRWRDAFRIHIISGDIQFGLAGYSRLAKDEEAVLHVLCTVCEKHFISAKALHALMPDFEGPVGRKEKRDLPDIITPNLYFFRPCPDGYSTPLFARQYEKIKFAADGQRTNDQYHRIHALTRAGLDPNHALWVHWKTSGEILRVESPGADYHGESYWSLGQARMKSAPLRAEYDSTLNRYCLGSVSPARSDPAMYEIEHKFLIPATVATGEGFQTALKAAVCALGYGVESERAKRQMDVYFDDDRLTLHAAWVSFRLRKQAGSARVTLKKRMPAPRGYAKRGVYERIEEEAPLSKGDEARLLSGQPVAVFPYRLLAYVAPGCGALGPALTVENRRTVWHVQDRTLKRAEICLDEVYYCLDGRKHGPVLELEIEGKGLPAPEVQTLADLLAEALGLVPSLQSKYERGVSLLRTGRAPGPRKRVIIDTDAGVDDALALILALRSPELEILAITAVAGNVGVDKVVPNIFKVFRALHVTDPPLVAVGADRPLLASPITADSVHGFDGLGDAVPAPAKEEQVLDSRPAWQLICELARSAPKDITLITLGPLTNVAHAIGHDPEGVRHLKEIVSMGGVFFEPGTVAPDAEFNVAADPDAAKIVMEFCRDSCLKSPVDREGNPVVLAESSPDAAYARIAAYREHEATDPQRVPLTFIGLDVTRTVLLRRGMLDRLVQAHATNSLLGFVRSISAKYMDFYDRNEGLPGCHLHDPLAVAYVINPGFVEVEPHILRVETGGRFTRGVIFPDDRPTRNPRWRNPAEQVIGVARRVEKEAFEEFLIGRLTGV